LNTDKLTHCRHYADDLSKLWVEYYILIIFIKCICNDLIKESVNKLIIRLSPILSISDTAWQAIP